MSGAFDPRSVERFRFLAYGYDEETATASLEYGFDDDLRFTECFTFAGAPRLDAERREALERCLFFLHLAAGVSYYKAAAPSTISVETRALGAETAAFFDKLYLNGLGEFAYRNELDLEGRIRFPVGRDDELAALPLPLPRRVAVPVGGGKDSVVAIEALRLLADPLTAISVGDYTPIRAVTRTAGLPWISIRRQVSPRLIELNRRGAYNGHVPISAIFSFVLATAAVLYGFDSAVMANERSADVPDAVWKGRPVNHEYSKSLEYERDLDRLMRRSLLADFKYFSLLRPFSELSIAGLFSRHRGYFPVFRSCNAAFRMSASERAVSWCGECPKCRFVFLALAPFLRRDELVAIFGSDLLADESAAPEYEALLGLTAVRPWECVGEAAESQAALALLAASPDWRDAPLVRRLTSAAAIRGKDAAELVGRVLEPASEHLVPRRFDAALASLTAPARDDRERLLARLAAASPSSDA